MPTSLILAALLPVIPQPTEWKPSGGTCDLATAKVTEKIITDASLGNEGYRMSIRPGAVEITADAELGLISDRIYPALAAIATNRRRLDRNADFPCAWVAREYPRRRGNREEARWWPVSAMFDKGIQVIRGKRIPVTGVLWYQGESNATTCVRPDTPTPRAYQEETLRAVIDELRGGRDIPFVMMGLPKMNRPWEQYRDVQKKIAAEKGAIFVDTFAAGLGDPRDVHPRDKIPFAELAVDAL